MSDGDIRQGIEGRSRALLGVIIDARGFIVHPFVTIRPMGALGNRKMNAIHGIVLHQTGGKTLQSALDQTKAKGEGTHFYIDRDGTILQAASFLQSCWHVGLLKSRCMAEYRCKPDELKKLEKLSEKQISAREYKKDFPDRYPDNNDSIGIELVGEYHPIPGKKEPLYDSVTQLQQDKLKWLLQIISKYYRVQTTEIYHHPEVSWKNKTEAISVSKSI